MSQGNQRNYYKPKKQQHYKNQQNNNGGPKKYHSEGNIHSMSGGNNNNNSGSGSGISQFMVFIRYEGITPYILGKYHQTQDNKVMLSVPGGKCDFTEDSGLQYLILTQCMGFDQNADFNQINTGVIFNIFKKIGDSSYNKNKTVSYTCFMVKPGGNWLPIAKDSAQNAQFFMSNVKIDVLNGYCWIPIEVLTTECLIQLQTSKLLCRFGQNCKNPQTCEYIHLEGVNMNVNVNNRSTVTIHNGLLKWMYSEYHKYKSLCEEAVTQSHRNNNDAFPRSFFLSNNQFKFYMDDLVEYQVNYSFDNSEKSGIILDVLIKSRYCLPMKVKYRYDNNVPVNNAVQFIPLVDSGDIAPLGEAVLRFACKVNNPFYTTPARNSSPHIFFDIAIPNCNYLDTQRFQIPIHVFLLKLHSNFPCDDSKLQNFYQCPVIEHSFQVDQVMKKKLEYFFVQYLHLNVIQDSETSCHITSQIEFPNPCYLLTKVEFTHNNSLNVKCWSNFSEVSESMIDLLLRLSQLQV